MIMPNQFAFLSLTASKIVVFSSQNFCIRGPIFCYTFFNTHLNFVFVLLTFSQSRCIESGCSCIQYSLKQCSFTACVICNSAWWPIQCECNTVVPDLYTVWRTKIKQRLLTDQDCVNVQDVRLWANVRNIAVCQLVQKHALPITKTNKRFLPSCLTHKLDFDDTKILSKVNE